MPHAIIGHEKQLEDLRTDIAQENVAHAYLFSGPEHLGKTTAALWFARELLCKGMDKEQRTQSEHMIERLTHPDLLVLDQLWIEDACEDWSTIAETSNIAQEHRKQAGARTDTISIDDIRALQQRLYETGLSPYRCCIIRGADRMQDNAANAFLKILEEPPQRLVFILTADSPARLLPTIVSRTRTLTFHRLSPQQMQPLFANVSADDRQFIMLLAQGAPGIVHELAADPEALRAHRLLQDKARSFWRASSLHERLHLLTPLHKRGADAQALLLHLALALRQQSVVSPEATRALTELGFGLQSNAHRQILVQKFALNVAETTNAGTLLA